MIFSSPAIGGDGNIYVGSNDDKLYSINADGSLKWSFTTGGDVESSPAIGADGTIYVGSHDGKLYAIGPGPASTATPVPGVTSWALGIMAFILGLTFWWTRRRRHASFTAVT